MLGRQQALSDTRPDSETGAEMLPDLSRTLEAPVTSTVH